MTPWINRWIVASMLLSPGGLAVAQNSEPSSPILQMAPDSPPAVDPSPAAPGSEVPASPPGDKVTGAPGASGSDAGAVGTIPLVDTGPRAGTGTAGSPVELTDVTVTATKRREKSRDVPFSINAFKGDDLQKEGHTGLAQIVQESPGVSVNNTGQQDGNYVSIRGISTDSTNSIYTRPTGLFLDDVPLSNPSTLSVLADVDPFDLQDVEILKGPQGTLFGGSALAGAVRYVPKEPRLGTTQVQLNTSVGYTAGSDSPSDGYAAMINAPIGSFAALRTSGILRRNTGWIDDTYFNQKDSNTVKTAQGRAALLIQPLDSLSFQFSYFMHHTDAADGAQLDNVMAETRDSDHVMTPTKSNVSVFGIKADWDLGPADVVVLVNELQIHGVSVVDDTPSLGLDSTPATVSEPFGSRVHQPTAELRLVSSRPLFGITYLAGLWYMNSTQFVDTPLIANTTLDPGLLPYATNTLVTARAIEKASFFDLKRTFFNSIDLDVGGRLYFETTVGSANGSELDITAPTLPAGLGTLTNPITTNEKDTGFNPKVALTWHPFRQFSTYASYVRGFRFGGLNAEDAAEDAALNIPPSFHSDHLDNYELGIRTDWFRGRLTFDVTGFYIMWKDPQIQQLADGAIGYLTNVGAARVKGVESQIKASLPWGFLASVGGSYVDSRTTVAFASGSANVGYGTRLPETPYNTGFVALSNKQTFSDFQLLARYAVSYHGSSHNNLQDDTPLPGYCLNDLSANLSMPSRKYRPEVTVSVTNLMNRHVLVFGEATDGVPIQVGSQPRTAFLTLGASY